uniref:Protein kinase domain-containing protein n=1 Tax=Macrostomum lignano TaxID=282301 RepID=A0A1I8IJX0_9PLAT
LALTFDDRITPGIQLTWDPTFSGQTAMNVSRSSSKLQLAVETYYILLKSKALAGNVTATMVEAIFSANVNKVLSYFGTGSILRSAHQYVIDYSVIDKKVWNPDCSKLGALRTPEPRSTTPSAPRCLRRPQRRRARDYLGKTGVNFEIASLTMEASYARFTFSKWLRQVFEALRDYRLLNPVHSNLLTEIDNNDPTALANAIADLAVSSASRHFVVSSSIFSNLRVSAELIPTSSAAAAGRSSRRRRSADKASPPGSTCGFSHQVRLTLWFSHQDRIKPVLSYLITRSLLEAVNSAGLNVSLNESQIELAYISVTTHAVEFLADLALLPCPSTAAAPAAASMADDAALQQRFYSSWLRNSVAGRLLQQRLAGLHWQRLGLGGGWQLRMYKSLLLDHWPWSDSITDRRSLHRLRLTAKLLGILQLVYNNPNRLRLLGFDFDVQRTEAGVRVFMFEDLLLHGDGAATSPKTVESIVLGENLRREAEIRSSNPLLMTPFNMTELYIKVLHIEAIQASAISQQQPLQQQKTLLISLKPAAALPDRGNDSAVAWLGLAEAALRSIRVFGTPEQLRLRLFEDSLATSASQRRPDRSVTILADSLCNDTSQAAYGAAAAKAFSRLGTGIVTEFLFCDIALHFDSAAARQMAQGALPTGAVFRVNHTAIDERDEAMSTEQQRRVPRDRLTEFWTNMIVMRRGGLSAATVRQYILDRFDLWNLLFPYSNIRTTDIQAQVRIRHLAIVEIRSQLKNWNSTSTGTVALTEILKETIRQCYYFGSEHQALKLGVLDDKFQLIGFSERSKMAQPRLIDAITKELKQQITQHLAVHLDQLVDPAVTVDNMLVDDNGKKLYYANRFRLYVQRRSDQGHGHATFLQFKAEYSLSVSNASVSKEEVHKTFSTGWDQRQLKSMLSNALLHNIEIVPSSEPENDRESALVYLFTMLSSTNDSSGNELSKLAQSQFAGLYLHTKLVKLHHVELQLADSSVSHQVSAKLLLDLEVNARGHHVSDIVSFETHAGLGRVRAASQLKIVDGFFVPVMHSNSFNKRRVYKLMPVLIKIRIEKSEFMFDLQNSVLTPLLEYQIARKLETAFGAKRHYSALGVKAYSIDKLASNKFAVGIVAKIGLLNAQLDHDVLALLSDVRTAYDVIHMNWPLGAFSAPSGPPIRIMRLEHQLQISGLGFAGDAAAAGAQFSREFTQNFVCDSIGFIYNFETPSAISNCSCSFALSGTEQTKIFAKYTMTFSTAESSLFNQATVERVFNKGLLLFNAEFSGGHPMTSLSVAVSASLDVSRSRASQVQLQAEPPSLESLPEAQRRILAELAASIVAEAEAGGASPNDTTPVSSRLESPLPEAAEPLQQKPPSSGEVLLLGVGLGVVSAAGAVTAIAICLYLAWRLRSWRRNRQRLRLAAAPAEDTAAQCGDHRGSEFAFYPASVELPSASVQQLQQLGAAGPGVLFEFLGVHLLVAVLESVYLAEKLIDVAVSQLPAVPGAHQVGPAGGQVVVIAPDLCQLDAAAGVSIDDVEYDCDLHLRFSPAQPRMAAAWQSLTLHFSCHREPDEQDEVLNELRGAQLTVGIGVEHLEHRADEQLIVTGHVHHGEEVLEVLGGGNEWTHCGRKQTEFQRSRQNKRAVLTAGSGRPFSSVQAGAGVKHQASRPHRKLPTANSSRAEQFTTRSQALPLFISATSWRARSAASAVSAAFRSSSVAAPPLSSSEKPQNQRRKKRKARRLTGVCTITRDGGHDQRCEGEQRDAEVQEVQLGDGRRPGVRLAALGRRVHKVQHHPDHADHHGNQQAPEDALHKFSNISGLHFTFSEIQRIILLTGSVVRGHRLAMRKTLAAAAGAHDRQPEDSDHRQGHDEQPAGGGELRTFRISPAHDDFLDLPGGRAQAQPQVDGEEGAAAVEDRGDGGDEGRQHRGDHDPRTPHLLDDLDVGHVAAALRDAAQPLAGGGVDAGDDVGVVNPADHAGDDHQQQRQRLQEARGHAAGLG